MSKSEIALIRAWIDQEVEALQQIKSGFAQCASHEVIMGHYRVIDVCFEGLAKHIGEEAAIDAVCERIDTIK